MTAHFPLRFEFNRDPDEQIEAMFAGSANILSAERTPGWYLKNAMVGLAIALVVVLAMLGLGSLGFRPDQYNLLFAGFFLGIGVFFFVFQILFYRSIRTKYRATLRPEDEYLVELDEEGIRSTTRSLTLESPWRNIGGVTLAGDILLIRDEVMSHYIPARVLPDSMSLAELQELVQSRLTSEKAMR